MVTRSYHSLKLFLAVLFVCLGCFVNTADSQIKPVTLAVVNSFGEGVSNKYFEKSIELISQAVAPSPLKVTLYSQDDFLKASERGEFDLAIASSGLTSIILDRGGTLLLATVSAQAPDPNFGSGAVILTAKDRDDINTFADLEDKKISVMSKMAFAGYYIPLKELEKHKVPTQKIIRNIKVASGSMLQVLRDVKEGRADAGFVVTCLLENMQEPDLSVEDFKIIGQRKEPNFYCVTSSELYPNWVLSAMPTISAARAKEIVRLLINMPPSPNYDLAWSVSTDYRKMQELMAPMLEMSRREDAVMWFLKENRWYLIGAAILIVMIFLNSIYVGMTIRRRTAELNSTMEEKLKVELENQKNLARIESLQRASAIGLISSTVAHELKQPLAVINNYVEGLKRRLQRNDNLDKNLLLEVIEEIGTEGSRAADIVEMVRRYRKTKVGEGSERGIVNLSDLTSHVVELMKKSGQLECNYDLDIAPDIHVRANPVDIELVIMNLIRNAFDAMSSVSAPLLQVSLKEAGHDAILIVRDNGPAISDEQLEMMNNVGESTKKEGLGLGLAIVRQILEATAGSLRIVRNETTGLSCIVKIPLVDRSLEGKNGQNS